MVVKCAGYDFKQNKVRELVLRCSYLFKIPLDTSTLLLDVLEFGFLFLHCREWISATIPKRFLFWLLRMNVKRKCNICKVDTLGASEEFSISFSDESDFYDIEWMQIK